MNLDSKGQAFIQSREGLRLNAYLDTAGVPTIGYGTIIYPMGNKVKIGDVCTPDQAYSYFSHDLLAFEKCVKGGVNSMLLTQNQFNALVSFCYNIGSAGFRLSTLRRCINNGNKNNKDVISVAFLSWNKIRKNGILEVSEGLSNRRKKEIDLYFTP